MPTLTSLQIPAREVTVKDTMSFDSVTYTVADVNRKPVWTYIEFIGGTKPLRVKADEIVIVERMIKSDEEKAIEIRAAYNGMLARYVADAEGAVVAAAAKVAADPAYYTLEALVTARRLHELYATVARVAEMKEIDLVAAAEHVVAEEKARLLDANFTGCSTSVMSNAVDAVRLAATQKFIRSLAGW